MPQSMVRFLSVFKTQGPNNSENTINAPANLFVQWEPQTLKYIICSSQELQQQTATNNEDKLTCNFLRNFNLCIRSQIQQVPSFTPASVFEKVQLRRWDVSSDSPSLQNFYEDRENEVSDT